MKVYVKFFAGDITVDGVESTDTKNNYFVCYDADGDKLFAAAEHNIMYVEYKYDE